MSHPHEQIIERIAIVLAELGFSKDWDLGGRAPVDIHASLPHVLDCAHCRQILEILLETENAWRSGVDSTARILPLRPFRQTLASETEAASNDDLELVDYPVAAADASARPTQTRARTLSTDDGRFLVSVHEDEVGGEATAILVTFPTEGAAATAPKPALRFAGVDYEFDDASFARLPEFPSSEIALIARNTP